jgi:hypothetical protein
LPAPDGCDECVATTRNVGDETIAIPTVAKHLSKHTYVDANRRFVDGHCGPGPGHDAGSADRLASGFDKDDQHVERPASEVDRPAATEQKPLFWK